MVVLRALVYPASGLVSGVLIFAVLAGFLGYTAVLAFPVIFLWIVGGIPLALIRRPKWLDRAYPAGNLGVIVGFALLNVYAWVLLAVYQGNIEAANPGPLVAPIITFGGFIVGAGLGALRPTGGWIKARAQR